MARPDGSWRANIKALTVNAQLADAQRQLDLETTKALQSVQNEYERARLEERTLSAGLEDAKRDAQDLGRKSVSYNVMEREARSNRTVYESLLQRETFELVVQVNGKVRDRVEVGAGASEDELVERAKASPKVQAHLDGKEIRRAIVVPGKLVNFVL